MSNCTVEIWSEAESQWLVLPQDNMKIITTYDPPPIPPRQFDWSATLDDYDGSDPIGFGRTEQESIDDLKDILNDE